MGARAVDMVLSLSERLGCAIVSCRLVEGISEHVHATVIVTAKQHLAWDVLMLDDAVLALMIDGEEARRWTLKIGSARFLGLEHGSPRYALELFDALWPLGLGKSTRKFRKLTTQEIVSRVLGEAGITPAWRTTAPSPARNYVVQYRETHLDFVRRLLANEGIYHTIDERGGVVFADASPASARVAGASRFELVEAAGALDGHVTGIHEFYRGRRVAPGQVAVDDASWKNPGLSLVSQRAADRDAELAEYVYPAGFREPQEGARLAQLRLESHRALADYVEGKSSVAAFAPARSFTFGDAAGDAFAGDYLLVRAFHTFVSSAYRSELDGATYHNSFVAIPLEVPFRPRPLPRPVVAGNHTAMVRGPAGAEIHTDAHGRFKAQFHWDREATGTDADSRWIRMVQESATSMFLARVGWEVSVGYIDGDPDRPVGLGRNVNGVMTPTYAQPSNRNVMTVKTPSSPATGGYSEIRLDDTSGAQRFDLRAERDFAGLVEHDQTESVGRHELHLVGASLAQAVAQNRKLDVGGDSTTAVNGEAQLSVQQNRTRTVGGDERVDVSAAGAVSVKGNDSEDVGSLRITLSGSVGSPAAVLKSFIPSPKSVAMGAFQGAASGAIAGGSAGAAGGGGVGGAAQGAMSGAASGAASSLTGMIPSGGALVSAFLQGSISRAAKKGITRTVGGGFISVAAGEVSTKVMAAYAETVGGAKVTLAGGSIQQTTSKLHVTTVGGAILRSAMKAIQWKSKVSTTRVGAMAAWVSSKEIVLEGAKVQIKAGAQLSLSAQDGDLAFEMKPGSLSWIGKVKIEADTVKLAGNTLNLTKA